MQSDFTKTGTPRKNKPGAGRPKHYPATWKQRDIIRYRRFGLTPEQVARRIVDQGGCAVCRVSAPRGKNDWHVDHDHSTGRVRGVVCLTCNIALGMMHDNSARCRAAADYLDRHAQLQALL